jgi:glutamate dehydrogenase (NAD(P)+)
VLQISRAAATLPGRFGHNDLFAAGCVTGKPASQGGVDGRTEATGLGVFYGTREFLSNPAFLAKHGMAAGVEGKAVVVQGFGNVGYFSAKFFADAGARVVPPRPASGVPGA